MVGGVFLCWEVSSKGPSGAALALCRSSIWALLFNTGANQIGANVGPNWPIQHRKT